MSSVDPTSAHDALVERVLARRGIVVLLGGIDTGKTTMAREILAGARAAGLTAAWIDTDLGQSSIGPPATLGLRHIRSAGDLTDATRADALHFVGDISPRRHFLPVVVGTAALLRRVRGEVDVIVVDTSGFIAGLAGQHLKLHKLELTRPDHVVALQRGEELEPLLAVVRRFLGVDAWGVPVHPAVVATTVEQRAENRRRRLSAWFGPDLRRFRVPPEVFLPSLPPGLDLALLDALLVGLDDGRGGCLGVGKLEHNGDHLSLVTAVTQAPKGLRLGSLRLEDDWRPRNVDLRAILGSA